MVWAGIRCGRGCPEPAMGKRVRVGGRWLGAKGGAEGRDAEVSTEGRGRGMDVVIS